MVMPSVVEGDHSDGGFFTTCLPGSCNRLRLGRLAIDGKDCTFCFHNLEIHLVELGS